MKKVLAIAIMLATTTAYAGQADQNATLTNDNAATASNAGNVQGVTVVNGDYYEDGATRGPSSTHNTSDSRLEYSGEYTMKNTPTVSAPGLTTTMTETCMGSTSGGAGWSGFGLSFGTTWRDTACVRRLDARQLHSLGYTLGAKELMCDSPSVAAALKRAGKPCYNDLPDAAKRPEDRTPVVAAPPASPVVKPKKAPALGFMDSYGG